MANNYSRQRETVYTVLRSTKTHPSADWIYEQCKQVIPNISLGTVYRNLELLAQQGKIVKINVAQDKDRYDADTTQHSHIVCPDCGKVRDCIPSRGIDAALGIECAEHGDTGYSLVFTGLCDDCEAKRKMQSESVSSYN